MSAKPGDSRLIAIVHISADVLVRFPPGILQDKHISEEGTLNDAVLAEAAKNAAVGFLSRDGEIDCSGDLGIPFCAHSNRSPGSSMIAVDAGDWTHTDADDQVRVEEET